MEVAEARGHTIAGSSPLALPKDLGRIRVRVAELGGGARWFVRLYGELRQPGDRRTTPLAQNEPSTGERLFDLDPRLWQLREAPLQLQLGVEGDVGAFALFEDVAFLPAAQRPNRPPRKFFQAGQKDIAAVELMPNLPEPFALVDWREKARAYDWFVFDWCFGISDCRGGWGVTVGNWGGYDCDGLLGSIDNLGGYAFAMNTFAQAGALTPLVRYDPRYARAIAKWMLNLANAARLFYPGALPPSHETSAFWKGDPQHLIAYEGLRREWLGQSPCATGDPVAMKWGPKTDLGLYGSSYVGMLGAMVHPTDVPRILQLDCLATDFFHDRAWPTFLCYNPYPEARTFEFAVGPTPSDLYDTVTRQFLKRKVRHQTNLTLPPDSAAVIVVAPADGKLSHMGQQTLIEGVTVSYR